MACLSRSAHRPGFKRYSISLPVPPGCHLSRQSGMNASPRSHRRLARSHVRKCHPTSSLDHPCTMTRKKMQCNTIAPSASRSRLPGPCISLGASPAAPLPRHSNGAIISISDISTTLPHCSSIYACTSPSHCCHPPETVLRSLFMTTLPRDVCSYGRMCTGTSN